MRLRENEILAATAVAMYIVFFALHPPDWVRTVLANPVGMAALFGGSVYVALYLSKLVGGLLIVAFVLSMTRVTEHLSTDTYTGTFNPTTYRNANADLRNMTDAQALQHWNDHGKRENRQGSGQTRVAGGSATGGGTPAPPATYTGTFNPTTYRNANADLRNMTDAQALQHWNDHGKRENRQGSGQTRVAGGSATPPPATPPATYTGTFNPTTYRNANPDLRNMTDAQALQHWNDHGKRENRQGSGQTRVAGGSATGGGTPALTVPNGSSYGCNEPGGEYGMVIDGKLRGYASPTIATSYDPSWSSARKITCTGMPRGDPLTTVKPGSTTPPPAGTGGSTTTPPAAGGSTTPSGSTRTSYTPPSTSTVGLPRPVMSCNLENFAPF
jgi:hypothetical protein